MQYPKMLYTGDKEQYSCRTVQDADEEQQFRENGLVDYADLDEPKPAVEPTETADNSVPQGFVTAEQFDAVAEQLTEMKAEIERLKQAATIEMSGDSDETTDHVDYSSLKSDQLRALLDEKGIAYLARDSKDALINLLG